MNNSFTRVVNSEGHLGGSSKELDYLSKSPGRYLSSEELDRLSKFTEISNQRLNIVKFIFANRNTIIANATRKLFAEEPQLISPGGNTGTNRSMAACLRDMEIILRYVNYALIAGNSSVLEDAFLGLRETYIALGIPGATVANAIQKMKEVILDLIIFQEDQNESKELTILEIRKLYPKQWVTIEVTKSRNGFVSEGRVIHHDHDIDRLSKNISQLSGEKIYTFFTGKINEKPVPILENNKERIILSSEHKDLLFELESYFKIASESVV